VACVSPGCRSRCREQQDVDPITDSDEVARLCYDALIGSEFELKHGWHVNLMPNLVLKEFPGLDDSVGQGGVRLLTVEVPSPADLLVPSASGTNLATVSTKLGRDVAV
jgi:hypothetical protein